MLIDIYFDGACDNNSKFKFMGVGVAVFLDSEYKEELSKYAMVGTAGTSNIAEWEALKLALSVAYDLSLVYPRNPIRIYGDSQLIVRQYIGKYEVRQPHLMDYKKDCRKSASFIPMLKSVSWIPRTENKKADILSKKAITEYLKSVT